MKRSLSIIAIISMLFCIASCAQKRFVRSEQSEIQRYNIVYDRSGKCGVYDNIADALATDVKYDKVRCFKLNFIEGGEYITYWSFEQDGSIGMLSIGSENNTVIEIIFSE